MFCIHTTEFSRANHFKATADVLELQKADSKLKRKINNIVVQQLFTLLAIIEQ
jgi:hypothetical protein